MKYITSVFCSEVKLHQLKRKEYFAHTSGLFINYIFTFFELKVAQNSGDKAELLLSSPTYCSQVVSFI